jgi:lipopolysaccharide transport system permease protein
MKSGEIAIIKAGSNGLQDMADLWTYRRLLGDLAWRDLLVLYKQTALGVAWSVIRPLVGVFAFTVVFGHLAKLPSPGLPYSILVLTGMLPWQYFSTTLQDSSQSLTANAALVSKIYFPRLLLPLAAQAVGLVDLVIATLLLLILLLFKGLPLEATLLLLPLALVPAFLSSLGLGMFFGALNVKYRDFRYVVPFLLQIGLYASPVGFSVALVPGRWRFVYALNPMVGVIQAFRWCVTGRAEFWDPQALAYSLAVGFALLVVGVFFFRSAERRFADVI